MRLLVVPNHVVATMLYRTRCIKHLVSNILYQRRPPTLFEAGVSRVSCDTIAAMCSLA